MSFDDALPLIPEPWVVSHLIRLDNQSWQCSLIDGTYLVNATGDSPFDATFQAINKTSDDTSYARLWLGQAWDDSHPPIKIDLIALGLRKPILRRLP